MVAAAPRKQVPVSEPLPLPPPTVIITTDTVKGWSLGANAQDGAPAQLPVSCVACLPFTSVFSSMIWTREPRYVKVGGVPRSCLYPFTCLLLFFQQGSLSLARCFSHAGPTTQNVLPECQHLRRSFQET